MAILRSKPLRILALLLPLGVSSIYAVPPPPPPPPLPPEIWEKNLAENRWNSITNVEITEPDKITLTADRSIKGLLFSSKYRKERLSIDFGEHKVILGSGGLVSNSPIDGDIDYGWLTSSVGTINIINKADSNPEKASLLGIGTTIVDHGKNRVGLNITRDSPGEGHRGVVLYGHRSNTFTGDTTASGVVKLNLSKIDQKIAISGNLNIVDGAHVRILLSEQIANSSRVSLISKNGGPTSELHFNYHLTPKRIKESFRELYVEGKGVINFSASSKDREIPLDYESILYLEDLIIAKGSKLRVDGWVEEHTRFLVSKHSKHLDDALKKVDFRGYDRKTVGKREFDANYWEIYAQLPEAATYGAILTGSALGIAILRRPRLRKVSAPAIGRWCGSSRGWRGRSPRRARSTR